MVIQLLQQAQQVKEALAAEAQADMKALIVAVALLVQQLTLRVAVLAALGVPKAAAEVLVLGAKVAVDPQEHLEITPEVEDQEDLQ